MKLSGSSNDTSASANASPVVNKHEHPPTPTIEEQLDKILAVYRDRVSAADDELQTSSDPEVRHNWHKLASEMKLASGEAKAALTLLITKAEQAARYNEIAELNRWLAEKDLAKDCPSRLFVYIIERFSDLQPQPSYSPAPGTDGES